MKLSVIINICLISILAFFSTSCEKELTGSLPPEQGKTVLGTGDYQPMNEGSMWVYSYVTDNGKNDLFTIKATKDTLSFDTLTYKVFTNYTSSAGLTNTYYTVNNHNYLLRQNTVPGAPSSFPMNFLYLNDTYYDNDSWQIEAGKDQNYTARVNGIIIDRDMTMNINNLEFPHVIHSQLQVYYNVTGVDGSLPMCTYDYYIALNVGIVKVECKPSSYSGGIGYTQAIVSYTIK